MHAFLKVPNVLLLYEHQCVKQSSKESTESLRAGLVEVLHIGTDLSCLRIGCLIELIEAVLIEIAYASSSRRLDLVALGFSHSFLYEV